MTKEEFEAETGLVWGELVAYAHTWLKDEDLATEATVKVLEELTKKAKYLKFQMDRDGAKFATWFKQGIRLRCIDILRKEKRRRKIEHRGPRSRKRHANEPIEEGYSTNLSNPDEQIEESDDSVDYFPNEFTESMEEGISIEKLELKPGSEEVLYSETDGEDEDLPEGVEDVQSSDRCRCQKIAIQRILDILTPELRRIIHLHYWHDLTHQRIAEHLGLTPRQIQTRLEEATVLIKQYATGMHSLDEMLYCDEEVRLPRRKRQILEKAHLSPSTDRVMIRHKLKRHPIRIRLAPSSKHLTAIPDTRHIPWLGTTGIENR